MANLPAELSDSLTSAQLELVTQWWENLSETEQEDLLDCSQLTVLDFMALDEAIGLDELDGADEGEELPGYFDYLVNHEFRLVGFVDETAQRSSYRVMCSYVASLGSDYRHGKPGSVW